MKKQFLKGILLLSLAGTLALSGVTTWNAGPATVFAGYKIVTKGTLDPVTNIKYDSSKKKLSWNKVSGATRYYITVKNAAGTIVDEDYEYGLSHSITLSGGTYTVSIEAVNTEQLVLVKDNVASRSGYTYKGTYSYGVGFTESGYNYSEYDSDKKTYSLYKYPAGKVTTASITVADPASEVSTTAVTSLKGVSVKEKGDGYVIFTASGSPALKKGERLVWEYSNNAKFQNNYDKLRKWEENDWSGYYYEYSDGSDYYWGDGSYYHSYKSGDNEIDTSDYSNSDKTLQIYYNSLDLNPGDTVYVRARVRNINYKPAAAASYEAWKEAQYSPYTATVKVTVPQAKMSSIGVVSTTSSIELRAYETSGAVTGYQFAKKVGSKWVTLGTQTDNTFVDSSVASSSTYQYRVRAYSYNKSTKKTYWTEWLETKAITWGSNLNVQAEAASATSVKLTWNKISGAEGYEVYRYDSTSSKSKSNGSSVEAYTAEVLIKTAGKSAKSYTDKKLAKNGSYSYEVRAYKTIGKQKVYLVGWAGISLKAGSLYEKSIYVTAAGKKVVTWNKRTGIKGYYVEQYNRTTEQYERIKTLKASATSYTFAKVDPGEDNVEYRIRPYDANTVYSGITVTVEPTIAAPTKVKATKTANGVKITWAAVKGADYYRVYRTKSNAYVYDKTTKSYTYIGTGEAVYEGAVNTAGCAPEKGDSGYRSAGTYATRDIRTTTVEDKALTYTKPVRDENGDRVVKSVAADGSKIYQTEEAFYDNVEGPEAGNTYYYYVKAFVSDANGKVEDYSMVSLCTKAAGITYTNKAAKKVSKITSVKSKKKGQATVSYKKVSGVNGYAVYRSTKKNGTYTLVGTTTKTSFTDTSAPAGKTVYYKVASYVTGETKANIYSAKTAAKSVKVKK